MTKKIIYLILIMSVCFICFSQNQANNVNKNFYRQKLKLNVKERVFKDTVVTFRNYIKGFDNKRIMSNNSLIDNDIEKLIWESKYIEVYLTYQHKHNQFSIISYKTDNQNGTIVRYFLCNRDSKETVEMVRFKVENKKIIGINGLPYITDKFIPVEEIDNPKYHHVSPIME